MIRLGVNLDHIATLRKARGENYPNPVRAALCAEIGGADNITCHLREDRRHVEDRDLLYFKDIIDIPLNLEIANTTEMLKIACSTKPHCVTLVPEKRQELTTEGGLFLRENFEKLKKSIHTLKDNNILVCLFINPTPESIDLSKELGAEAVELHTGVFTKEAKSKNKQADFYSIIKPLQKSAQLAHEAGLQVHVGHGINYHNAAWIREIPYVQEANIGHSIIARSLFVGLEKAVKEMKNILNNNILN